MGLEAIAWLAGSSGLPVLVKGVLRGDDARACVDAGAAGVVVSNHGGRQLDRALSTARALPEVVAAVPPGVPVLVDGGLRSGLDVLCALALGAQAVLLGRPVLWALSFAGAKGVEACLRAVTDDLADAMALAGAADLAHVTGRPRGRGPRAERARRSLGVAVVPGRGAGLAQDGRAWSVRGVAERAPRPAGLVAGGHDRARAGRRRACARAPAGTSAPSTGCCTADGATTPPRSSAPGATSPPPAPRRPRRPCSTCRATSRRSAPTAC